MTNQQILDALEQNERKLQAFKKKNDNMFKRIDKAFKKLFKGMLNK
ncbi:hypothetical protein CPT_Mater225 [Bacillus phage Mater]|uniref:Uncharacterized protein n=1 Tax=Bacillus phage Mater TaxID=1540090 RepID=A0A0A0RN02_9CAUD|nr:hypothetical protein CPT_Mater3 [Bacillus phage Mater]YP_009151184.1 hypothetical protein CPT_Mater225 [Bacillus phage Mater]AIW03160.1 hypothetical protein CPT_Mater3 [Bacillus phage Mater]AIW03382.1 hypothetical protein CPT_Mater225 [Bacillus phage Mater]